MIPDDLYQDVLELVSRAGARIECPAECEEFLDQVIAAHQGTRGELIEYMIANVGNWFKCVNEGPRWIQEAEWQFFDGRPMVFIGQHDILRSEFLFHDDASFYVFYSPEHGVTKTIVQVA
jgi:hypothetical protein